jgi:hypothetical protein
MISFADWTCSRPSSVEISARSRSMGDPLDLEQIFGRFSGPPTQ